MTRRDQLTAELDTIQDEIDLHPTPELRRRRDALAREINIIDNACASMTAISRGGESMFERESGRMYRAALTKQEAAAWAGTTPSGIQKAIDDEKLCARMLGRRMVIEVHELERYLRSQPHRGRAPVAELEAWQHISTVVRRVLDELTAAKALDVGKLTGKERGQ